MKILVTDATANVGGAELEKLTASEAIPELGSEMGRGFLQTL